MKNPIYKRDIAAAKLCAKRCGFNSVYMMKGDNLGAVSFYAQQVCLFKAKQKDVSGLLMRLVENLDNEGWYTFFSSEGVKLHPRSKKWSIVWVRIQAEPPPGGYKPTCGICGRLMHRGECRQVRNA
jgi:hypothetical protein